MIDSNQDEAVKLEACPVCGTKMPDTSIGPYCPNEACPVSDDWKLWHPDPDVAGRWYREPKVVTSLPSARTTPANLNAPDKQEALDGEGVEGLVERLNLFTTCGCGDDDWPLLRHDTVAALSRTPSSPQADVIDLLSDLEAALALTSEHSPAATVSSFVDSSTQFQRLREFLHARQHSTMTSRGEEVERAVVRLRSLVTHADCYGERAEQPLSVVARNDLDLVLAALAPPPQAQVE